MQFGVHPQSTPSQIFQASPQACMVAARTQPTQGAETDRESSQPLQAEKPLLHFQRGRGHVNKR